MKKLDFTLICKSCKDFIYCNKTRIFPALKYGFSIIITCLAFFRMLEFRYLIPQLLELLLIILATNILLSKHWLGRIVHTICMFLYNAQVMVMLFANSYVTMVMLTNFDSLEALSGNAVVYGLATILVFVFSLLPVYKIEVPKINLQHVLTSTLCLELIFSLFFGNIYSPIFGYINLGIQQYEMVKLNRNIQNLVTDFHESSNTGLESVPGFNLDIDYYNEGIIDYREKNPDLPEKPNIILIFAEGLSQNIISDERGIMANLSRYQRSSLNFTGYYNHTFATYRGLIGQLYSGYQLRNTDTNPLISIQSILSDQGYRTAFINAEPHNEEFTAYLNSFEFAQLIGDKNSECNGDSGSISDKDMYQLLYQTIEDYATEDTPFFISMYTFGTHISLDSTDEKLGNGMNPELNKFYNLDQQFNTFMEQFLASPISDDTILIFTTDHATYKDEAYDESFPLHPRTTTSFDEIPLFFYHKNIEPENIAVNGRNSLCLAPTVLDYLDISVPNYFLGTSLFTDTEDNSLETTYSDSYTYYSSKDGQISELTDTETKTFREMQQAYFITKETHNSQP